MAFYFLIVKIVFQNLKAFYSNINISELRTKVLMIKVILKNFMALYFLSIKDICQNLKISKFLIIKVKTFFKNLRHFSFKYKRNLPKFKGILYLISKVFSQNMKASLILSKKIRYLIFKTGL